VKRGVLKALEEKRLKAAGERATEREEDVTPYMAFSTKMRGVMREEFSDLTMQALTQKIGQRWSMLPEDAKARYRDLADRINAEACRLPN